MVEALIQTESAPDYIELENAISSSGMVSDPAEIHGVVTGARCRHRKTGEKPDLMKLLPATDKPGPGAGEQLAEMCYRLYRATMDQLLGEDLEFHLLLPPDETPVAERTEAMAAWCSGYLLGLLHGDTIGADQYPGDSAEIIGDIIKISEATAESDDEDENWAYAEVEEYLRVGIQLVFESIYAARASAPPEPAQ